MLRQFHLTHCASELHQACSASRPGISQTYRTPSATNSFSVTLHVQGGHKNIVRMLIEAGADVDALSKSGQTPLQYCQLKAKTDESYVSLVRLLEGNTKHDPIASVGPMAALAAGVSQLTRGIGGDNTSTLKAR